MWWKHERNQIWYPRCYSPHWCYPQRRRSNHSNWKKSSLRMWINSLAKIPRTSILVWNSNTRWCCRSNLSNFDLKKRYCCQWRAYCRNSTCKHEGISSCRRIFWFYLNIKSCYIRKSIPSMRFRPLGTNEWRSSWNWSKSKPNCRSYQKKKRT